jgi:hypothetical protein
MTLEELQAAYPAWVEAYGKKATGYRYCANCGAQESSCGGAGVYSLLIPQWQNHPAPASPHIRFYDEIGELCLSCAESLPLTGLAAQQLKELLSDYDIRWERRRARERGE